MLLKNLLDKKTKNIPPTGGHNLNDNFMLKFRFGHNFTGRISASYHGNLT